MPKRRRKRRLNKRARVTISIIVAVCILTGIGLLFTPVFNIESAWCEGNNRISQEEIMEAANIKIGKNIFTQSISDIKKNLKKLPLVDEVNARRVFPNKIKVWVRERIPAAYIYTDGKLVLADVGGKILEVIEDERVEQMKEEYAPKKIEKEDKDEKNEEKTEEEKTPEVVEEPPAEEQAAEEGEIPEGEVLEEEPEKPMHSVPVVVGIELTKPAISKNIESKDKAKLKILLETFGHLEKAGLLSRATYLDINDMNDVTLMIENRLEVKLGALQNMEYRSHFLAKVINEKISAAETAIMDYRTEDIYVRPPEDGKERMAKEPDEEEKKEE